jgi:heme-degrading monooxygenase HmoA
MIMRIVSYAADSVEEARDWARKRGPDLREAEGIAHAYFFSREDPPEAGAVVLFPSEEALERYRGSDAYRRAVEEIGTTWALSPEPIREDVYELLDV